MDVTLPVPGEVMPAWMHRIAHNCPLLKRKAADSAGSPGWAYV